MTAPFGGFGRQAFGMRAFGAGGPLNVVRAGAIASHLVRIVFNVEPQHRSAAGSSDALNPGNYVFTVPGNNATAPAPMGVDTDPVFGPAYLLGPTDVGIDVHVDRGVIFGVVYNIQARNILAAAGGGLGTPDNANFGGVVRVQEAEIIRRNQDLVDFLSPVGTGVLAIVGGDIGLDTPDGGTKVRVYRRMFTKKNAFKFLKGYGTAVDLKGLASGAKLASLRTDTTSQIKMEPDVAGVAVAVSQDANGLTTVAPRVRTKRGTFVDVAGRVTAQGQVSAVSGQ